MDLAIYVYSPCLVLSAALAKLVESMGFEALSENAPHAELALWDLTTTSPPYPAPPPLPTVAIIAGGEPQAVALLQHRYRGYVTPTDDACSLKRALQAVRRGEIWADRLILTRVIDRFEEPQLTPKEQEVFHLLTKGFSNRTIGEHLHITEGTVKMHVSRLFSKLCVRSRTELIAKHFER